ncbi:hypothetical protein ACBQ08_27005, partial [Aneurinibacillus aneurinilyticus]
QGIPSNRAKMGDELRPIVPKDIKETVTIMHWVSFFFLLACLTVPKEEIKFLIWKLLEDFS